MTSRKPSGTCKAAGRSLGEELVARGIVRQSSLLRELMEQVEARFVELFGWSDGTLWFIPNVREVHLEIKAPSLLPALVTHAIREAYTEDELALWFARASKLPVARGPARRVDPTKLGLSLAERRALERAVKASSIEQLGGRTCRTSAWQRRARPCSACSSASASGSCPSPAGVSVEASQAASVFGPESAATVVSLEYLARDRARNVAGALLVSRSSG